MNGLIKESTDEKGNRIARKFSFVLVLIKSRAVSEQMYRKHQSENRSSAMGQV